MYNNGKIRNQGLANVNSQNRYYTKIRRYSLTQIRYRLFSIPIKRISTYSLRTLCIHTLNAFSHAMSFFDHVPRPFASPRCRHFKYFEPVLHYFLNCSKRFYSSSYSAVSILQYLIHKQQYTK